MDSCVKKVLNENFYLLCMDKSVDYLRKAIWCAIHANKGCLSDCDISMAISLVQYELIHHTKI